MANIIREIEMMKGQIETSAIYSICRNIPLSAAPVCL
jgi:hypothetical protein